RSSPTNWALPAARTGQRAQFPAGRAHNGRWESMDRYRRARLVLVVAAVVLFAGQYQPSYAGNTIHVTLTWSCGSGPVWSENERMWLPELPVHGILERDPPTAPTDSYGPPPVHV